MLLVALTALCTLRAVLMKLQFPATNVHELIKAGSPLLLLQYSARLLRHSQLSRSFDR